MSARIDATNMKYGRWYILGHTTSNHRNVICVCDCGVVKTVDIQSIKRGLSKSCGCHKVEFAGNALIKHSMCKSPEYRTWSHMKSRCNNPSDHKYYAYGARGIRVCDRWSNSFSNFYTDMGAKPSPTHSIDRIDNNGDYTPKNCRWATPKEQAYNKSTTTKVFYKGKAYDVPDVSALTGIRESNIRNRIKRNWSADRIFEQPERGRCN